MLNSAFFLVLRRMRIPIVILIVVYAISVLGLTLIPGVDAEGKVASPLSFFHAFYFISYTATTIGFGEVPNAFSDAQRLWVVFCIYMTVIGWSYTIITLIGLLQDKGFQLTLVTNRFMRRVRRQKEAFFIICGCGETGGLIARTFDRINRQFVVLEKNEQRVQELDIEDFSAAPPALACDASLPNNLYLAGLTHPKCRGVLAMTDDDEANLAIAIAVRLINPKLPIVARARSTSVHANMASFGTNHIINPFERFADHLVLGIARPERIQLIQILTRLPDMPLPEEHRPPSGYWILCGYGRFGRAIAGRLQRAGIAIAIIDPNITDAEHRVVGDGTEASTLEQARIHDAVGIIAGTHNDVNNLSIAVTARQIKPDLFIVARQNQASNSPLFDAFGAGINVIPSYIVAQECMAILTAPLLATFLEKLRNREENWSHTLVERLKLLCDGVTPVVWEIQLNISEAPAAHYALMHGQSVNLGDILCDNLDRSQQLAAIPLLLKRSDDIYLLPNDNFLLLASDKILFASTFSARHKLSLTLQHVNEFNYILNGQEEPNLLWRWLSARFKSN